MSSVKQLLQGMAPSKWEILIADQRAKFDDQESLKIVKWLSDLNFWTKQDDIFQRGQEGTGEWLLSDPTFRRWINGDTAVLWCPGDRTIPAFLVRY